MELVSYLGKLADSVWLIGKKEHENNSPFAEEKSLERITRLLQEKDREIPISFSLCRSEGQIFLS